MQDGAPLSYGELRERLPHSELLEKLYDAKVMFRRGPLSPEVVRALGGEEAGKETDASVLGLLCQEWAQMLLGDSFGTGEYSMYGAFTVDLQACTITDDPNADPVVENITIAT